MGTIAQQFFEYSYVPSGKADELRDQSADSWKNGLSARALYVVQAIVSTVATPLIAIAGLLTSLYDLAAKGESASAGTLKTTAILLVGSFGLIPTSLLAAVMPHSMKWDEPLNTLMNRTQAYLNQESADSNQEYHEMDLTADESQGCHQIELMEIESQENH